jgi:hypothetical protein
MHEGESTECKCGRYRGRQKLAGVKTQAAGEICDSAG